MGMSEVKMGKYSFLIIPYRKISFAERFGYTVRDLMIMKALDSAPQVADITWCERPDTIPEALQRMVCVRQSTATTKTTTVRMVDYSIMGPLRHRRSWSSQSIARREEEMRVWMRREAAYEKILLDFHPFYIPPKDIVSKCYYWYDLIDNFEKHNRFNKNERELVHKKYEYVRQNADHVTGVSGKSIDMFDKASVLPNRLLRVDCIKPEERGEEYDFGFLGFITDKIDIECISNLASRGYKILLCGHGYQKEVLNKLRAIKNVDLHGGYAIEDVPLLLSKFKVGLIPYNVNRLHDESPIKFFQYVSGGKPVFSSAKFNEIETVFEKYIYYYGVNSSETVELFMSRVCGKEEEIRSVALSLPEMFWEDSLLDEICQFLPEGP